ncbi:NUDIX hydrolase [Actinokineospora auranticolor]|uniref:ADP-ribose pyrophosphatase YjhB (NUDIX family) n=1 Tax=Actinokineospora auranticolor TaxID=155976 RepID=A0A2S6GHL6_9PSEU|nr:NUDIX hydrolase [Actinokineospora auranticolor]PPK64690.1 ADP-ribose pyrophosphatase YjhB (NUDIX family) [Actinokineospora auranticolor]
MGATQWTVHGTRRVYASPWVNVDLDEVEIPGRAPFEHHVLRFPRESAGAVVVDAGRVLLLWRHRFIGDRWGWEIPAGWVDEGEDPAAAAVREVHEETGHRVGRIEPLVAYQPMNGISTARFHLFTATGAVLDGAPDPTEAHRVEWVPLADFPALVARGELTDGPTLTALGTYLATR